MDKRSRIEEFLIYGGDEMFSTLMTGDTERPEVIDRLVQLLQAYSDSCRRINGRSAAYRFMLRKAERSGWLGSGSKDLKSHRLTLEEHDYIIKRLDGYISSGGRASQIKKKLLNILLIIIAAALLILAMARYIMQLETYQNMSGSLPLSAAAFRRCQFYFSAGGEEL